MESLRGKLLVSSERLGDPNFVRTVVLMVAHGDEGALGVVLNRPMKVPVSRLSREVFGRDTAREDVIYSGGPCESSVMAVFSREAAAGAVAGDVEVKGTDLLPGVKFSADGEEMAALLTSGVGEVKFFAGYSGWSAGQLEGELEEEAWLILDAREEHVFARPEKLWELVRVEIMLGRPVNPGIVPDDPSMN